MFVFCRHLIKHLFVLILWCVSVCTCVCVLCGQLFFSHTLNIFIGPQEAWSSRRPGCGD